MYEQFNKHSNIFLKKSFFTLESFTKPQPLIFYKTLLE